MLDSENLSFAWMDDRNRFLLCGGRGHSRNEGKNLGDLAKKESKRLDIRNKKREGVTDYFVALRVANWERSGK